MANNNKISIEQKLKIETLVDKRATEGSLNVVLDSGILADLVDFRASIGATSRNSIREILCLPEIMVVNYELTFDQMMVQAGIPESCIRTIQTKLGSKIVTFDYRGSLTFEYEDVFFNQDISTKQAIEHIEKYDSKLKSNPFCVSHLLAYVKLHPDRIYSNIVLALGKTIEIDGKQHVFGAGSLKNKLTFDLIPAFGHRWNGKTRFPKCREV